MFPKVKLFIHGAWTPSWRLDIHDLSHPLAFYTKNSRIEIEGPADMDRELDAIDAILIARRAHVACSAVCTAQVLN